MAGVWTLKTEPAAKRSTAPPLHERQYKLLVDALTDHAIYMLDPDGFIVSWNPGAERLKGYKSSDILGSHFALFYTPEDRRRGAPRRALRTAAAAGRIATDGWRLRKDGSRFWASVVIDPIFERGKLLGFAKITRDITQRREFVLELQRALERLMLATESGGIGIWDWDLKGDVIKGDDLMRRLYGSEPESNELRYDMWQHFVHPDDRATAEQAVADALRGLKPYDTEFRIVWKDGSVHDIRGTGRVTRDSTGRPLRMVGTNQDISTLKQAERARDEIQAQVEGILENMKGYLFQRAMAPDGSIYYPYVSRSLYRMLGMTFEPGQPAPDLRHIVSPLDWERVEASISQSARDFTALEMEFRLVAADGRDVWVTNRSSIRRLYNGTLIWDGFGTDISEAKRANQQLFYLTYHDRLTGFGNRLGFEADLEHAISGAGEHSLPLAIFFIDIADFRAMNDTLGVKQGDLIIRETAHRLQTIAGSDAVVARIAGDEFAVLKCATDHNGASNLADQICAGLGVPMQLSEAGGRPADADDSARSRYRIDVNIGIAGFPDGETAGAGALPPDSAAECMKRCDIALYEAKRLGRGTYCHYSNAIDHRIRNRTLLQQSLHLAIENDEFVLHYQPMLDFRTGKILAAEALVRWQHPKLGFQPPDQFIPLAEESGLIVPLGAWVLKTGMKQARQWRTKLGLQKIAVNVSAVQFCRHNFIETIEDLLRDTGATPDMIELELTESTLIDCSAEMLECMNTLRGMGFTLAIDDFGAGFSSLKYLSKLPVDKLKIDKWFVEQMMNDLSEAAIVRTVVALGKNLNLKVVAEGVETPTQRDFLLAEGCAAGQGYLFSKPLPPKEFEKLAKTRR